jgi:pimeloyl-ACP methyl ester carboxylesterase
VPSRVLRRALTPLGIAVLLAGCTGSVVAGQGVAVNGPGGAGRTPTGQPVVPTEAPAHFVDCRDNINIGALGLSTDRLAKLSFDCAAILVPRDYADPNGPKFQLTLIRIHDSDNSAHTGSLLVNPGGPGGSGIELALNLASQLSDEILTHFDVIGFDPRGVGESAPVHCVSDRQKDRFTAASPDMRTPAGFAQAKSNAKAIARACQRAYGADLADFNTVATAKDMELIRQAVGDSKMNYLGFSYGTELGAQYIHLFPDKIRVAVLDGAVDPTTDDITSFANQLAGFEGAFDQFAGWCTAHDPCNTLGNARQVVYQLVAKAKRVPIPSSAPGDPRSATVELVLTGVLQALYSQSEWPTLGQALIDAKQGDAGGLVRLADQYNERFGGHYTNILDANTAIGCNDAKPGPSDATIRATVRSWQQRFPMFGLWSTPSLFGCQQWQRHRTVPPLPTAPTAAHQILVIGNLHDPATPYRGALDLARTLGYARLLTWDGEGHTSYLQGSSCIDDYVDTYLVHGTLPPQGKTCPR